MKEKVKKKTSPKPKKKDGDIEICGGVSDKEIRSAILKKALGYSATEVIEEYQETDGEIRLTKKKVTKKDVPPDITAIKLLFEDGESKDVSCLTDEELAAEKERLLRLLLSSLGKEELNELNKSNVIKEEDK